LKPAYDEELGDQLNVAEWFTGEVPDPLSAITSGELLAVLVTVTPPDRFPVVVGSKVTLKEVVWPTPRLTGEKPAVLNPVPLALICEMETLALPVFVSVTGWVALVPVVRLPKLSDAGLGVSCNNDETPDPDRDTTTGEFGELFVSVTLPEKLLAVLGRKPTVKVDVPPGAIESGVVMVLTVKPVPAIEA
jgi:hypothetical protein